MGAHLSTNNICFYKEADKSTPASVAQLDAHMTGDQEVAGSTPAGSATFFRGD